MNKVFYFCAAFVIVFAMEPVPAEDNVLCGLEPDEGCSGEEVEKVEEFDELDEDFGRQITLFYSEVHSNKDKFTETFFEFECPAACETLGFSSGHAWQKLCESECSDFKSQVHDADHAKGFYGTGPGCGCGAGRSKQDEGDEAGDEGDGEEDTGTCTQGTYNGDSHGSEGGDHGFREDL